MLEGSTQKLAHAHATALECQTSLQNMIASAAALRLQLKSSQAYLMSSLLREDVAQAPSALWIYGPNPIFTGMQCMHACCSYAIFIIFATVNSASFSPPIISSDIVMKFIHKLQYVFKKRF